MNARLARMLRSERDSSASSSDGSSSAGRPSRRSGSSKKQKWHIRALQTETEPKCWTQADWGLGFEPKNEVPVPYTCAAERAAESGTAKRYAIDDASHARADKHSDALDADLLELDMTDAWADVMEGKSGEEIIPEVSIHVASPTRRRAKETSPRYRAAARAARNGTPSPTRNESLPSLSSNQPVKQAAGSSDRLDNVREKDLGSDSHKLNKLDPHTRKLGHFDTERLQHYIHLLCAEHKAGEAAHQSVSAFWAHFREWALNCAAPLSTKMGTLEWSPSQTLGWLQLLRIDPCAMQSYLTITAPSLDWTEAFVVEQLLNGVRAGLLRLGYSLHCLECDACPHYGTTLHSIPTDVSCGVCGKIVRALLNDNVAAHFALANEVYNCPVAGSPGGSYEAISKFEVFAMDVPPHGVYESRGEFECGGDYLVVSLFTAQQVCIIVSGEPTTEEQIIQLRINKHGIRPEWVSVSPGPFAMRVISDRSEMFLLTVVPAEAPLSLPPAFRPSRFSAFQLMHHAPWYTTWESAERVQSPLFTGSCACLVAEVSDFELLCSRVGDLAALSLLQKVRSLLRRAALRNGGRCLTAVGNRCILSFPHPGAALACALQTLMDACSNGPHYPHIGAGESMALQIGLHVGPACWLSAGCDGHGGHGPELFGGSVALCTALCGSARRNSIALHSDTFSLPACQDLLRAVEGFGGQASTTRSPSWATEGSTEIANGDGLHIDCKATSCRLDGMAEQQTIHILQLPGLYLYADDEQ